MGVAHYYVKDDDGALREIDPARVRPAAPAVTVRPLSWWEHADMLATRAIRRRVHASPLHVPARSRGEVFSRAEVLDLLTVAWFVSQAGTGSESEIREMARLQLDTYVANEDERINEPFWNGE